MQYAGLALHSAALERALAEVDEPNGLLGLKLRLILTLQSKCTHGKSPRKSWAMSGHLGAGIPGSAEHDSRILVARRYPKTPRKHNTRV